jgi:hypothetical protein
VNVIQQVGAALGLAVLVTVLGAASGHSHLGSGVVASASLVHGLDVTFAAGALFGILALVMVAALVHLPPAPAAPQVEAELVDGEGFEWSEPELVA